MEEFCPKGDEGEVPKPPGFEEDADPNGLFVAVAAEALNEVMGVTPNGATVEVRSLVFKDAAVTPKVEPPDLAISLCEGCEGPPKLRVIDSVPELGVTSVSKGFGTLYLRESFSKSADSLPYVVYRS